MLIAFGFAWAARSLWVGIALAVLFAVIYIPVIRAEEEYLRGRFAAYEAYAARVPRLIPRLRAEPAGGEEGGEFSAALYRKHREYNALMGAAAIYAALILKMFFWR